MPLLGGRSSRQTTPRQYEPLELARERRSQLKRTRIQHQMEMPEPRTTRDGHVTQETQMATEMAQILANGRESPRSRTKSSEDKSESLLYSSEEDDDDAPEELLRIAVARDE